ncbi:hypothetical protein [Undibacterium sp. TC9W]|uniref:hypothetical protein n=1 Tax=Undibacterium sp. TC9W TaxID=3413053 RepID=UPI003BEFCD01
MQTMTELDFFSKTITGVVQRREYSELEVIMRDVLLQENKIILLAALSDRLTSTVFVAFFLCGLPNLLKMPLDEYRHLYQLSKGRDIAIYQITRFLIIHAGARKQVLQSLCSEYSEIQSIDQFKSYLEEVKPLPPNEKKMCELTYRDYKISAENILRLQEKFATCGGGEPWLRIKNLARV